MKGAEISQLVKMVLVCQHCTQGSFQLQIIVHGFCVRFSEIVHLVVFNDLCTFMQPLPVFLLCNFLLNFYVLLVIFLHPRTHISFPDNMSSYINIHQNLPLTSTWLNISRYCIHTTCQYGLGAILSTLHAGLSVHYRPSRSFTSVSSYRCAPPREACCRLPPADTKQCAVPESTPSGRGGGGATLLPISTTCCSNRNVTSNFSEEKQQDLSELETENLEKQRNGLVGPSTGCNFAIKPRTTSQQVVSLLFL